MPTVGGPCFRAADNSNRHPLASVKQWSTCLTTVSSFRGRRMDAESSAARIAGSQGEMTKRKSVCLRERDYGNPTDLVKPISKALGRRVDS